MKPITFEPMCSACNDSGDACQECCPHDERDHFICLDCGHESDPGEAIDRAMDYWEGCND